MASVNAGNETVPTVRLGQVTFTNPSWGQLARVLPDGPWLHEEQVRVRPALVRRAVSWLPVALAVAASIALDALGHSGASWAADALAVAAWWLTRPMRR